MEQAMAGKSPWVNEDFAEESLENIDSRFLPGTRQEVDFLETELGLTSKDRVIDLGCGAGRHSIELARRGYDVTGVDISRRMLQEAENRAGKAGVSPRFMRLDLRDLSEHFHGQEGHFVAAVSFCESGFGVLGWKGDLAFMKGVLGLLAPGGGFVLTTYNGLKRYRGEDMEDGPFDYISGTVLWQTPDGWPGGEKLREQERVYIPSELGMLLELAGFAAVKICGCAPGDFSGRRLSPDDTEMMVVARKPR